MAFFFLAHSAHSGIEFDNVVLDFSMLHMWLYQNIKSDYVYF